MRRRLLPVLLFLLLPSCAWFVSRKEADDMGLRVERVSSAFAARSADEATLKENLARLKVELEKIREERENYMGRQAQFMEDVRGKIDDLQTRVQALEQRLAAATGKVDSELFRQLQAVTAALAARAQEITELERLSRETAWVSSQLKPEELGDVIAALAAAKQWKLAQGHLALMIQKHPGSPQLGVTVAGLAETAFSDSEFAKVVLYADLYRRLFPSGPSVARVTFLLAQAHAQFMDCARAIPTLKAYVASYPDAADFQAAQALLENLEKMRHSRQVCAP
ncbi:outer membrane protein assembly factor BamD [Myxococcota bacterium]|nr:outer membrane protein assembly factor BamD [Myxococcota bacterium]MBU1410955.1 outer membrane protein assembly factor BamD [Myxococcota bacterium]MBU1510294.1 outer membrane protein assembly factor BamD [Myxococcota bacterium]